MCKNLTALLLIPMLIIMLASTGCTIGTKQSNKLVTHNPIPLPESAKGVVRIFTNKKLPLIVDGIDDSEFFEDVGGDVVVKPGWYSALVDCWNKYHSVKVNQISKD